MYLATWAVLIQFLFGLIVPLCTGADTPCDEDGTPKYEPSHPIALDCVLALKNPLVSWMRVAGTFSQ